MSKKSESETLRQQRIARKEFLELKKMQSGEIDTGPKPSEVAIVPKTFSEKVANIWYHFGKLIIVAVILTIALAVMVVQCATRTKYDLQIIYFSYTVSPDTAIQNMADYFEQFCDDVNGDGEVHISVVNCSFNPDSGNNTVLMKLQAMIAAEPSALLYITDDKSIEYFNNLNSKDNSFFTDETVTLSEEFYKKCSGDMIALPENLTLRLRKIENTQISKEKDIGKFFKASEKIFESVK